MLNPLNKNVESLSDNQPTTPLPPPPPFPTPIPSNFYPMFIINYNRITQKQPLVQ